MAMLEWLTVTGNKWNPVAQKKNERASDARLRAEGEDIRCEQL